MPTPDTDIDAAQAAFLDDFLLNLDDDNAGGEEAPPKLTARQQRVLEAEAASAGYKPKHEGPFQFRDSASSGTPHPGNVSLPDILPRLHWLYRRRHYREALDRSLAALRAWSQQEAHLTADKKRDENETIETIDLALRCCGKLTHSGLASGEDDEGSGQGGQGRDGETQVEAEFEWLQGLVVGLKVRLAPAVAAMLQRGLTLEDCGGLAQTNTLQAPALALAAATVTREQCTSSAWP